jgi:hypothetical protein
MKNCVFIIILVLVLHNSSSAQEHKTNNIFLEIGGNSLNISVNYDRIIFDNWAIRAGAGMLFFGSPNNTVFPVLINRRFYIKQNYIEAGIGLTYCTAQFDLGRYGVHASKNRLLTGLVGYCFQVGSNFNWRVSFTPFFYDKKVYPFAGLSLGYSF